MVRNLKSNHDFSRELSFLFHRSIKIRNSGFAIFGAGLLIMIFGLCLWLLSLHLSPSVLDFDIDVPLSFFNSSEGEDKLVVSDFGDAFGGFLTNYSKLLLGVLGLLVVFSTAHHYSVILSAFSHFHLLKQRYKVLLQTKKSRYNN